MCVRVCVRVYVRHCGGDGADAKSTPSYFLSSTSIGIILHSHTPGYFRIPNPKFIAYEYPFVPPFRGGYAAMPL